METLLEPTSDPSWLLTAEGYDPLRESIYEARFAISNGIFGVRGGRAISRGSLWMEPLRTYIAGLFDISGPEHLIPGLVTAPGWLQARVMQLLNPPPSGYRIDITWENPSVLQKTKDVTLQANIPHDFGAQ